MSLTPDEHRILQVAAPALLELYHAKREVKVQTLLGAYRGGQTDLRSYVAEISLIEELIKELEHRKHERNVP